MYDRIFRISHNLEQHESEPKDLAVVYRIVKKEQAPTLTQEGIVLPNYAENKDERGETAQRVEEIFNDVIKEKLRTDDPRISRMKCIYAFPRDPSSENSLGLPFNQDEDELVTFQVDAARALVCDGECFTEAYIALDRYGDEERAREWAERYWDNAMVLSDYLGVHTGDEDDHDDFSFPEVLVFQPVAPEDMQKKVL